MPQTGKEKRMCRLELLRRVSGADGGPLSTSLLIVRNIAGEDLFCQVLLYCI